MEDLNFKPNPDNRFDTQARLRAIESDRDWHKTQRPDDDGELGYTDPITALNAIRIRERVKTPDDIALGRDVLTKQQETIEDDEYTEELNTLKLLNPKHLGKLLDEVSNRSQEDRGLFSKGPLS
jgi:hypothetical protein